MKKKGFDYEEEESKTNITQSTWRQTEKGEWKLFFNLDENIKDTKEFFSNKNKFIPAIKKFPKLGCMVMTPNGIGTLIKSENKISTVKFLKDLKELKFEDNLVISDFPIFLKTVNDNFISYNRLYLPANGDVEILKKTIEKLKIIDSENCDFNLIHNGFELNESLITFDSLNIKSDDKILLSGIKKLEYSLIRFTGVDEFWYCNPDAIIFSVNKKIKLSGISLYLTMEGEALNGSVIVYELEEEFSRMRGRHGSHRNNNNNNRETTISQQSVFIPGANIDNRKTHKLTFTKPILIQQDTYYKIELKSTESLELWYGTGGKITQQGDKGVIFAFKQSMYESQPSSGNFPEFYYYV